VYFAFSSCLPRLGHDGGGGQRSALDVGFSAGSVGRAGSLPRLTVASGTQQQPRTEAEKRCVTRHSCSRRQSHSAASVAHVTAGMEAWDGAAALCGVSTDATGHGERGQTGRADAHGLSQSVCSFLASSKVARTHDQGTRPQSSVRVAVAETVLKHRDWKAE